METRSRNNSRSNVRNGMSNMGLVSSLDLVIMADLPGDPDLDRDTDLPGHRDADLVRDGDADWPGNLPGVLDGTLVALPLSVSVALGSAGVSMDTSVAGISLPLAMVSNSYTVSTGDHMGVVTHDTGAVVNLLGDLVALLRHDVLALLDMGRVHNSVILLVALLGVLCVAGLVMLSVAGSVSRRVVHCRAHSLTVVVLTMMTISRGRGQGNG